MNHERRHVLHAAAEGVDTKIVVVVGIIVVIVVKVVVIDAILERPIVLLGRDRMITDLGRDRETGMMVVEVAVAVETIIKIVDAIVEASITIIVAILRWKKGK